VFSSIRRINPHTEGVMNTPRKLEDIASDLDDISLSVEELKETAQSDGSVDAEALDEVQRGIARASEAVDDAADPKKPDEN
jgi:hypothetical protein